MKMDTYLIFYLMKNFYINISYFIFIFKKKSILLQILEKCIIKRLFFPFPEYISFIGPFTYSEIATISRRFSVDLISVYVNMRTKNNFGRILTPFRPNFRPNEKANMFAFFGQNQRYSLEYYHYYW